MIYMMLSTLSGRKFLIKTRFLQGNVIHFMMTHFTLVLRSNNYSKKRSHLNLVCENNY